MKKGHERDKKILAKIAKALYSTILKQNIPIDDLENIDFDGNQWTDLLSKVSKVLEIDDYDLDEISFYTILITENIQLLKENKLNENTIFIPELKDFTFDVTETTSETWERTYSHSFKAYDPIHAREALIYDLNNGNTNAWDGNLVREESTDSEVINTTIE